MDALITAAGRALAAGDPLGALNLVALRDDPSALALRGIAMARLGDLDRAKALLRQATRGFGPREAVARARSVVAEAEIALASRELPGTAEALAAARATLEDHGDRTNAAHARLLEVRRCLLVGDLDGADEGLAAVDLAVLHPASRAVHALVVAGVALRRLATADARAALDRAWEEAHAAAIPALLSEVERASLTLAKPAARRIAGGSERLVQLGEVESLLASGALIVDGCRRVVRRGEVTVSLATRPVLFDLAQTLGEAWPGDVSRAALLDRAFGARFVDESHRARLRVEIGRLRAELDGLAGITSTDDGYLLVPEDERAVVVLVPPVDGGHAQVLALLADGELWSSSALALALGVSQRTVQRSLEALATEGEVQSFGRGRALRWTTPPVLGFTTILLLPTPLPA